MLNKICEPEDMPTARQFRYWLTVNDGLAVSYARARLSWADTWAEKVMDITFNPEGAIDGQGNLVLDHATIALLKLQTDNVKWLVGKWAPRTYGDKPQELPTEPVQQLQRLETVIIEAPESRLMERIRELEAQLGIKARDEAPRQLTWDPGPLPSRLHGEIVVRIVGLIKSRVPAADQRPPEVVLDELIGVIDRALIAEYGAVS